MLFSLHPASQGSSAATPTFELVAAASTTLRQTVSSTGTIEPAQQAHLNFGTSGQVTSVDVTVGQKGLTTGGGGSGGGRTGTGTTGRGLATGFAG